MKKLIIFIAICMAISCQNQDSSKLEKTESSIATSSVQENYSKINLEYDSKENKEVRKFKFLNLGQDLIFITFLESELSYLEIENKRYYNIDYDFGVNSNLEESVQLFKDKKSGEFIFLFRSSTEEFPTFHVMELRSNGGLKDHGKHTFSWNDFNLLETKNVNEIVYDVSKDGNTIKIHASAKSGKTSTLNFTDTFQPIAYSENKIQFDKALNKLENSGKATAPEISPGEWAINCENGLTQFNISSSHDGQLSLYSDNQIYINFKISEVNDKEEYKIYFKNVASQKEYYPDKKNIIPEEISQSKEIGSFKFNKDGNITLTWKGLYNEKLKRLEFTTDFLLRKENDNKQPIVIEKCL